MLERQVVVGCRSAEILWRRGRCRSRGCVTALVSAALYRRLVCWGLVSASLCRSLVGGTGLSLISALGGNTLAFAAAEQLHIVGHYFGHILFLPLLIVVGAGAYMAFYIYLATLAYEFFRQVRKLSPEHEIVPLGILPELSVAVAVAVGRCKCEGCDFCILARLGGTLIKVTYFRVSANVTDKQNFIQ